MRDVLLVGHGPNLLESDENSWDQLMEKLNKFAGTKRAAAAKLRPFQLEYETVLQAAVLQGHDEDDLADVIAEFAKSISPNWLHEIVIQLPVEHILTTNYDFALERAHIGEKWEALRNAGYVQETRYSLVRHFETDSKTYWHIHGDCRYPKTAALGLDHYSGYLQRIRNYVIDGVTYEKGSLGPLLPILRSGGPSEIESWVDLFLGPSRIHVLGYGLDFTEMHLWWLLAYRARRDSRKSIRSKVFYYARESKPETWQHLRNNTLESFKVEVVHPASPGACHRDHYRSAVDAIARRAS